MRSLAKKPTAQQKKIEVLEAKLAIAKRDSATARTQLKNVREELGRSWEVRDVLQSAVAMSPAPLKYRPSRSKKKPKITAVALLSDLQCGEVGSLLETDGWGIYNYAIMRARLAKYARNFLRYIEVQRHGYTIDECVILVLGDLISGDIHEELLRTNEFPPPVQAILAGAAVAAFAAVLAPHFGTVRLEMVGGSNHDRLTRKYQFKGGTLNSFDYVAHEHATALLSGHPNVVCNHYRTQKKKIDIAGRKYLCAHGDQVKAWMGIPYYGFDREVAREAKRHLEAVMAKAREGASDITSAGFDGILAGHWHVPAIGPNFKYVINGSLPGTNELDHKLGRFSPPAQVTFFVSHNHGLFAPVAWRLDDPATEPAMADERWT